MWKTVNSVYKSTSKNLKKLGKNIPNMSTVTQSIQKININSIIPKKVAVSQKQTQLEKAMKSIFSNKKPVMPINKMSLVAEFSYDSQNFELICQQIIQKLKVFKYNSKQAKQTLNSLVLLSYLIKNAPSGFVDQFREQMSILNQHTQLNLANSYITDDKQLDKLKPLLTEIRQRAKYIVALLTDKRKLLKEKQLAMQIKKKIIQNTQKQNMHMENDDRRQSLLRGLSGNCEQHTKRSISEKVDSFLQDYVWRYWNKIDEKMQNLTEKLIQKIQEYLDLQQPQSFSIQQIDDKQLTITQNNEKQQAHGDKGLEERIMREEQMYLKERNDLDIEVNKQPQGPVLNTDLI